ncbi:hypothetical protein [Clostridium perfringens]|uniref:hypothetical protein n=1 Tax=Clostridium perfringens TaxID=1502 RepID=UPI0024BC02F2|nr:hypothetical protein [Clostridium perfringens]
MSENVKDKLLKELVDNQINYEIEGEGEKEVIILDKYSVDKSFAIPQLKALVLDCLENSREYGVKLMLLATSNSVRLRRLNAKNELVDFLRSHNCPFTIETDMDKRVCLYQDDEETIHIDFDNCEKTKEFKEAIGKAEINGVYFLDSKEYDFISSSCITKETIVNDQKKFNEIEKRTKEKYNMGKDNEVLFENIENYYLSGHESYLKEVIDIATRNDLFVEVSSTGTSLNINHEGSTLLNLVLDGELSQEIKNKIDEATSLLVKENSRILSELTGGSVDSYEPTIEEYEEALKQADSLYEESQDYVNDYALPQKSDEKEREVKSIDFFTDSKEIGENAYQMELTSKGFKVVNDTPFEYMRKILSNRKVTFYTKKDDKYFIETEEGLIERTEQSLHEDIANCKFDVLIFKDGFRETKGKEDSVSLGDSRFIELLKAINEPKNLNTILNLGEQLEFCVARFDGVVDFSSYSEVILSFCIGDRGFECNTTINKDNPRVQAIIDMIEENPNWDEIFRLCNANHFNVAQVHDDVIIQDKEGNTILKFKDSKIKETPKQLAEPSDVEEAIRIKRCTVTTVESLQDCLDSLVNKDVDISLTYSIYCHLQNLINARGKLEVSYEDVSNLSDEQALKYWDKWKKDNPRKTHNEVIPIFEDLATEAVQLNIFINSLFWEALAFENTPNQEVDSEVEQAIETAIKEVSEKFNLTLGRFIEFQYETGRNVAKKKVKELQNKIEVEKDLEKKEELTQKLNNEYSVLEQAEVSIEEVDNAEACNISYFIETKVYRIIGKYKYLKYKDYIEYRARQGAESIVLDKKNVVDDMTKYLTISNRVMRPVRTVTFVYNKEAMKNFSKEEKLDLLNRILSKPTIPYFASEILPKNKVIERICIGTRTGKVQSLPFDIYLYCEGKDLMLNYLDENLNLSGINYEAFETILKKDLTVACLDERAYDKVRGYCDRKKLDSSRVFNLSEYMTKVYKGFRIDGKFAVIVNDKEREFYNLNKLPGVTTKIQ